MKKLERRSIPRLLVAVSVVAVAVLGATIGGGSAATQAAPVNVTPPTITGVARVGERLTAQNGTWDNSPTSFRYQWRRCDADGLSCTNILGAAATLKRYTLVTADVGHRLRVRVTAVNADGATSARSEPSDVVMPLSGPNNTGRPTITGEARVGEELTASEGTWTGSPTAFAFQWQRCDVDAVVCANVVGATGRTYGVRLADLGFRLRVQVTARNDGGTGTAVSAVTSVVAPVYTVTNLRPTLRILGVRFFGARVYARFRICDDSFRNLRIIETGSRPHVRSSTRFFSTRVAPRPCGAYTRNWLPARRFRGPGRYTITLRARDVSGLTSAPARRTFHR
jgi:hypothetical protein